MVGIGDWGWLTFGGWDAIPPCGEVCRIQIVFFLPLHPLRALLLWPMMQGDAGFLKAKVGFRWRQGIKWALACITVCPRGGDHSFPRPKGGPGTLTQYLPRRFVLEYFWFYQFVEEHHLKHENWKISFFDFLKPLNFFQRFLPDFFLGGPPAHFPPSLSFNTLDAGQCRRCRLFFLVIVQYFQPFWPLFWKLFFVVFLPSFCPFAFSGCFFLDGFFYI